MTNLSHDVRTPLASLIGYLEALDNGMCDNPKEYIGIACQKALTLKALAALILERELHIYDYEVIDHHFLRVYEKIEAMVLLNYTCSVSLEQ